MSNRSLRAVAASRYGFGFGSGTQKSMYLHLDPPVRVTAASHEEHPGLVDLAQARTSNNGLF
jgi:hypothetical protein